MIFRNYHKKGCSKLLCVKKISLLHQSEKVDVSRVLILFDQGILGPDLASIIKIECYERGEGNKRAVWSKETPVGLESSECSE